MANAGSSVGTPGWDIGEFTLTRLSATGDYWSHTLAPTFLQ
jgi:hypothetical protein